jgi:hypothetical protein
VFSKTKADMLAEHRPYDLKIDLEEGAELPLSWIYSLFQEEQKALRDFINENVPMGFIRPSLSPHGALVLFSRKKDGGLLLRIDFRGLNKLTKKDRYPLPRISDLLESPKKARIYTKIDLAMPIISSESAKATNGRPPSGPTTAPSNGALCPSV